MVLSSLAVTRDPKFAIIGNHSSALTASRFALCTRFPQFTIRNPKFPRLLPSASCLLLSALRTLAICSVCFEKFKLLRNPGEYISPCFFAGFAQKTQRAMKELRVRNLRDIENAGISDLIDSVLRRDFQKVVTVVRNARPWTRADSN